MLRRVINKKITILCAILLIFIVVILFSVTILQSSEKYDLNLVSTTLNQTIVQKGNRVELNYVASFEDGIIFDTSYEDVAKSAGIYDKNRKYSPLGFEAGSGKIIKGVDEAVIGMKLGEEKTIMVPPEKGYGEYNQSLIQSVPLGVFGDISVEPNMTLVTEFGPIRIVKIEGDTAIVDLNHPLAGKTLLFEIKVESINKTKFNLTTNETVTLKYFWLSTCGWCRKEDPILYEFLQEHPTLNFVFLDLAKEESAAEANKYRVTSTPTFVLIKGDTELIAPGFLSEEKLTEYVCSLLEDEKCLTGETKERRNVTKWW